MMLFDSLRKWAIALHALPAPPDKPAYRYQSLLPGDRQDIAVGEKANNAHRYQSLLPGDRQDGVVGEKANNAHRYQSLLPGDRQDGVVGVGTARSGVDKDVHVLVDDGRGDGLLEHDLNVLGLEHLLQRVEGKTRQLGLDKVGPVLHDRLELDVPVGRLPPAHTDSMPPPSRYQKKSQRTNKHKAKKSRVSPGDKVQHVDAVGAAALCLAGCAGQLDAQEGEQGLPSQPVPHLHQAGVEVDLAGQRGDGQQGGVAHDEEWGDCLLPVISPSASERDDASEGDMELPVWASAHVKEAWVDVGCLLEDDHVPSGALRR